MDNIIVVKRTQSTSREYWPRTDTSLIKTSIVAYNPDESIHFGRERDPKELGRVGMVLFDGVKKILAIQSCYLRPNHIDVFLRPGFTWDEAEPRLLDLFKRALRWDDATLLRYAEWLAQFGEEEEKLVFEDLLYDLDTREQQRRGLTSDQHKDSGIVIQWGHESVCYWPPLRIADGDMYVRVQLSALDEDDKLALERLGEQAKDLIHQILEMDGITEVHISPYSLEVTVSPAFNQKRIQAHVLRAIKEVYKIRPME